MHPRMLCFMLGMLGREQFWILGLEPSISRLLASAAIWSLGPSFHFLRQGLIKLCREASNLGPPTSFS